MQKLIKNPFFSLPILGFFLVGIIGLVHFPYGDEIIFFNAYRTPFWNAIFKGITKLGEWYFWAAGLLVLGFSKWKSQAIAFAAIAILLAPVNYILKDKIGIDRPITYFDKKGMRDDVITVPDLYLNSGRTSFPSGHTASAFALYTLLAAFIFEKKRIKAAWALLFALLAILIGFSRIFLVQHFLIDIMAGAILGLLLAYIGICLSSYITIHFPPKHIPLA